MDSLPAGLPRKPNFYIRHSPVDFFKTIHFFNAGIIDMWKAVILNVHAYSVAQSCPGSSLVFPSSLGDVPVMSPYWSRDGSTRLLPGLQLGGWDGAGSEDWKTTGWSLWTQTGESGLCLSVQEMRPGKGQRAWAQDSKGRGEEDWRTGRWGRRESVNHDSKVTLIACVWEHTRAEQRVLLIFCLS